MCAALAVPPCMSPLPVPLHTLPSPLLLQAAYAMADMALWESGGFPLHGDGAHDEESSEDEE